MEIRTLHCIGTILVWQKAKKVRRGKTCQQPTNHQRGVSYSLGRYYHSEPQMGSSSSCINDDKRLHHRPPSSCTKQHASRPRRVSQLTQVTVRDAGTTSIQNSAECSCDVAEGANANAVPMTALDHKPAPPTFLTAPCLPPPTTETTELQPGSCIEQVGVAQAREARIPAHTSSGHLLFDDVVPPLGGGAPESDATSFQPIVSVQVEGTSSTGAKPNSESYTSSAMLCSPFASLAKGDAFEHVPNPLGYRVAQQAEGFLGVHHVSGMVAVLNPKVVASDACHFQSSSSKRDGDHSSGSHTQRSGVNNNCTTMLRTSSEGNFAGDSTAQSTSASCHLALFAPSPLHLSRMASAEQNNSDGTSTISEAHHGRGNTAVGKFLPLRKVAPEGSSTLCKADVNAMLAMDSEEGIAVADASGVYPDVPNTFKRPLVPALSQTFQDGTHRLIPVNYSRQNQKKSEESSASFSLGGTVT